MGTSVGFRPVSDVAWETLQARADRFADARRRGPVGNWFPHLTNLDPGLRAAVLRELVKIDLEFSWKAFPKRRLEQYAALFPELGPIHRLPRDLIQAEYRYRHLYGDQPGLEEYRKRFPGRNPDLDQLSPPSERSAGSVTIPVSPGYYPGPATDSPANAQSHEPIPPGFCYLEVLGTGGFGQVWKAVTADGRLVAVKVTHELAPEKLKYAERELAAAKIQHEGLVRQFGAWLHDRRLYLVMELAGGNLLDRLKECQAEGEPGMPVFELLGYMDDVAGALDHLHAQNWIHRDIKPANILLVRDRAKVADFGLARVLEQPVQMATFAGTFEYMAPEVLFNRVSRHCDQYSLAVSYVQLRTGRSPRLTQRPDLSALGPTEREVVTRALAEKPNDRHPSCVAFVERLNEAVSAEWEPRESPGTAVPGL